jgi:hypothetical protein
MISRDSTSEHLNLIVKLDESTICGEEFQGF